MTPRLPGPPLVRQRRRIPPQEGDYPNVALPWREGAASRRLDREGGTNDNPKEPHRDGA